MSLKLVSVYSDPMPIEFLRTVPVLRMFDLEKAKEFYLGFLGFKIDWEHRFEPGTPLFMQISRGGLELHLSEHHGDGCPGAVVGVYMTGLDELQKELKEKHYKYVRPGIQHDPVKSMGVVDPFGNRIRFYEPEAGGAG